MEQKLEEAAFSDDVRKTHINSEVPTPNILLCATIIIIIININFV